jgi:putative transposase
MPRCRKGFSSIFWLSRLRKGRQGMRFTPSIFSKLLAPINRRQFNTIVARHGGDAYDKLFRSWDHLVAMIFAQFSAATSLRGLEAAFNANSQHHYHLGTGRLVRSTLADANKRRPVAVFAETFGLAAAQLGRASRREGKEMLRLIDSTPIPLGKLCGWAQWNGRIRGMKAHIVYDPNSDCPRLVDITHATVNDVQTGRTIKIEPGATYVFDKGYCHYGWWTAIAGAGSFFVTRPKTNMRLETVCIRPLDAAEGEGFTVLEDAEVRFASKGDSKLPIRLRRLTLKRHEGGGTLILLTNDLEREAIAIGALYKARWQIELFFRWMKQHLRIRTFLGTNENAIQLQIIAAMIAYALIRIAAKARCIQIPVLRFLDLVAQCLFDRRGIETIDRPPPVNPSRKRNSILDHQMSFTYA